MVGPLQGVETLQGGVNDFVQDDADHKDKAIKSTVDTLVTYMKGASMRRYASLVDQGGVKAGITIRFCYDSPGPEG